MANDAPPSYLTLAPEARSGTPGIVFFSPPVADSAGLQQNATNGTAATGKPISNTKANAAAEEEEVDDESTPLLRRQSSGQVYSIFTTTQKKVLIFSASLASTFSPLSSNIYYPALNSIANDLGVTLEMVNLTITSYMVFQAFTPSIAGSFSDTIGRRPVYLVCFVFYIGSNVALSLSSSYTALLVLRALQSAGSSATIALSNAIAADLVVSAERGQYMGLASLGSILAPSVGPILGGSLSEYFGWRSIFTFLAITSAVFFVPFVLFYPETSRKVVGNGSGEAPWWDQPLLAALKNRVHPPFDEERGRPKVRTNERKNKERVQCPNPFVTLKLLFNLPTGLLLLANGLVYAGYFAVTSSMPAILQHKYGLTDFQIGLSYVPSAVGSVAFSFISGRLLDWNYRRWAAKEGTDDVIKLVKRNAKDVHVERARLQIAIPTTYACAAMTLAYGWVLQYDAPLYAVMALLFGIGCSMTTCYNIMNLLIVDVNYGQPATATAANNLVRCMLGAGSTAAVGQVLKMLGIGSTFSVVAGVMVISTGLTWAVYAHGKSWRDSKAED